jgi:hypothetical protein
MPNMNFQAFHECAAHLRAVHGWDVVSPAELDQMDPASPTYSFTDFITRDLFEIETCDAIILLPGWETSRGASIELAYAKAEGKGIYYYDPTAPAGNRVRTDTDDGGAYVSPVTQARLFEEQEARDIADYDAQQAREAEAWGRVSAGWKYPETIYTLGDYADVPLASISQNELQPDDLDAALDRAFTPVYVDPIPNHESREMRTFDTGATRSSDAGKLDYEGFLSPLVLERFARYMHLHRTQADGTLRGSDNWQHGIPQDQYMKSLMRHWMDAWQFHRGYDVMPPEDWRFDKDYDLEDALCGVLFNAMGYLFEEIKP